MMTLNMKKFTHFSFVSLFTIFMLHFTTFAGTSIPSELIQSKIANSATEQNFKDEIRKTLIHAQSAILNEQIDHTYWNYPSHLSTLYISQYYLIQKWLKFNFSNTNSSTTVSESIDSNTLLDHLILKNILMNTQLSDGSWKILPDKNTDHGNINASIINYFALKVMGEKINGLILSKARDYILSHGGIEKSSLFTKVFLALFDNYNWDEIPFIPYIVFNEVFFLNYKNFGQWIGPHLYPIAYLKKLKVSRHLGTDFDISELYLQSKYMATGSPNKRIPDKSDFHLIEKIISLQKPNGSFGGYTSATLFSVMAFSHFSDFNKALASSIANAEKLALQFVESLYFESGKNSYLGVTCDGRYWDTALVGQGLQESGVAKEHTQSAAEYLLKTQDIKTDGFSFGLDFESYPDTDDTAEILLFFKKQGLVNQQTDAALTWLKKMQNSDGGWGAFSRNNNGNFILKFFTRSFLDSADMFDESSADVTGHILETFGAFNYNYQSSNFVKKAVDYLIHQKTSFGGWLGRWGNNYLYGTSAAVIGLTAVGVRSNNALFDSTKKWLSDCQNADGGFGETFDSYENPMFACKGKSTPTQTAWSLMALISLGQEKSVAAKRAAEYLITFYAKHKTWKDESVVGTGHPKIVPMNYPSYAKSFTLMALSRYLKKL